MLRRTLKLTVLATAIAATAMTSSTGARVHRGVDINLSVVNKTGIGVTASYCPNGHVSIHYQFGTTHDPCNRITERHHLHSNGGRFDNYSANPLGVIVRAPHHHTFYFYLFNPSVGRPYIIANGHKLTMVEGQETHMVNTGGLIAFHRRGDSNGHKQMIIEILRMGK